MHLLLDRPRSTACASRRRPRRATPTHRPSLVALWPGAQLVRARDVRHVRRSGSTATPICAASCMYEEFVGHPLRKDYPKEKRQPLVRRDELAD